jgi:N-acetylglucosamine transport system substrate-binding protein
MREMTPDNFNMVVKPVPGTDPSTSNSILAWSGENFIVPATGENPIGGLEYLRALMSVENAKYLAENVGAIMPVVGGTEGVDLSPAVISAVAIAEASGDDTVDYRWKDWYRDLSDEARDRTGDLLTGRITPDEWMAAMEAKAAEVREDPDVIKYTRE